MNKLDFDSPLFLVVLLLLLFAVVLLLRLRWRWVFPIFLPSFVELLADFSAADVFLGLIFWILNAINSSFFLTALFIIYFSVISVLRYFICIYFWYLFVWLFASYPLSQFNFHQFSNKIFKQILHKHSSTLPIIVLFKILKSFGFFQEIVFFYLWKLCVSFPTKFTQTQFHTFY